MRPLLALLAVLLAVPVGVPSVAAQPMRTSDVVSWRVRADRATAGASARVVLDAEIAPGWRLYAMGSPVGIPLTVALDPLPAGVRAGRVAQSVPREGFDEAFAADYTYFAGTARVVQQVHVARRAAAGTREVTGSVRYAVCDDRVCLPPTETSFRVPLTVE